MTDTYYQNFPLGRREFIRHYAASQTLQAGDSGLTVTNQGAEATVTYTLPPSVDVPGIRFLIMLLAAQEVRVNPSVDGGFYFDGSKRADGLYLSANGIGDLLEVVSVGDGDWAVFAALGSWSVEGA